MPEKILISILINGESKFAKKLSKEINLLEIRKTLSDKLPDDSIFSLPDGSEIEKTDEEDFTLAEILKDNSVHIKSQKTKK